MKLIEKVIAFLNYTRDKLDYIKNSSLDILYQSEKIITEFTLTILMPNYIISFRITK